MREETERGRRFEKLVGLSFQTKNNKSTRADKQDRRIHTNNDLNTIQHTKHKPYKQALPNTHNKNNYITEHKNRRQHTLKNRHHHE